MQKIRKIYIDEHSFIDMVNQQICIKDNLDDFKGINFELFKYFVINKNILIKYSQLQECWDNSENNQDHECEILRSSISKQVNTLSKLVSDFCQFNNVRGTGYRMTFLENTKFEYESNQEDIKKSNTDNSFSIGSQSLINGIKKFFKEQSDNYINTSTYSQEIVPYVKDINDWLGGIYEKNLIETVVLLWEQEIRDGLFIGKSGGGKSAAFFACVNYLLKNHPSTTPIYINLEECFYGSGEDRILGYIQSHYATDTSIADLKNIILNSNETAENKPKFVLLLDGLSNCINSTETANDIAILQKEFSLYNKPHIQLIFSAVNEQFPFTLGKISKQAFEIQGLSESQVINYLDSMSINHGCNTPYHILSNPFMLSIYAKTADFIASQNSQFKNKFRENITTEADILYNFFEAIAVKFAEKVAPYNQNKLFFAFDFILPIIAYYMAINVRQHISKAEIDDCVRDAINLLGNREFVTRFEDHYGEEYCFKINELIVWFVQQTGILNISEKGYTFNNSIFRNYLCAKHIYNIILMQNESIELSDICKQTLESGSLAYESRRYLGELCEEFKNKPYQEQNGSWVFPNKNRLLLNIIDLYRESASDNAKIAISNIVSAIAICREKDLSGLNLSFLDLRRLTFSNIICSRPSKNGYVAANFSGCDIDQWFFKTVQFCKDRSSVKILKNSNKIVSTTGVGSFRIYNYDGEHIEVSINENDFIQSLDVSPDETKILVSCLDSGIYEYDISENKLVKIIDSYGVMFGIAKYLTQHEFAYFTRDKKITIYDISNDSKITVIDYSSNNFCYDIERNSIMIASRSRDIVRYNLNRYSFDRRFSITDVSDSYIMQVAVDSIKNTVIYCTKDGIVAEWDIIRNQLVSSCSLVGEINDFVLSDDNTTIYCITENNGIYIINRLTQEITNKKISEKGRWSSIDINNDILVIGSIEGGLILHNLNNIEYKILSTMNPLYRANELHIKGCSFKNAKFSNNVTEQFWMMLENEGAVL
ncbi:MAG: WD40 repeat domain-containing protein [Clostridia bacterium]|nr:WD40 repeat domain-containing protein [Clostridia bacterium]